MAPKKAENLSQHKYKYKFKNELKLWEKVKICNWKLIKNGGKMWSLATELFENILVGRSMYGWMDGLKALIRIAYSNRKFIVLNTNALKKYKSYITFKISGVTRYYPVISFASVHTFLTYIEVFFKSLEQYFPTF